MEIWGNFFLKEESSIAEGMQELFTRGVEDLSIIEAEEIFFCGKAQRASLEDPFVHIDHFVEISEEINWQNQWELFCPYYKEGVCKRAADFNSWGWLWGFIPPDNAFGHGANGSCCRG
jgi:hypothetical protein